MEEVAKVAAGFGVGLSDAPAVPASHLPAGLGVVESDAAAVTARQSLAEFALDGPNGPVVGAVGAENAVPGAVPPPHLAAVIRRDPSTAGHSAGHRYAGKEAWVGEPLQARQLQRG